MKFLSAIRRAILGPSVKDIQAWVHEEDRRISREGLTLAHWELPLSLSEPACRHKPAMICLPKEDFLAAPWQCAHCAEQLRWATDPHAESARLIGEARLTAEARLAEEAERAEKAHLAAEAVRAKQAQALDDMEAAKHVASGLAFFAESRRRLAGQPTPRLIITHCWSYTDDVTKPSALCEEPGAVDLLLAPAFRAAPFRCKQCEDRLGALETSRTLTDTHASERWKRGLKAAQPGEFRNYEYRPAIVSENRMHGWLVNRPGGPWLKNSVFEIDKSMSRHMTEIAWRAGFEPHFGPLNLWTVPLEFDE